VIPEGPGIDKSTAAIATWRAGKIACLDLLIRDRTSVSIGQGGDGHQSFAGNRAAIIDLR
jgi:hypothetical protein